MSLWLIDETGTVHPPGSPALRELFRGVFPSDRECAEYLEVNLGYVSVRRVRSGLHVRWRPTFVRGTTFAAVIRLLSDQPAGRTIISTLGEDWEHRLLPSVDQAVESLRQEFSTATSNGGGYFSARPVAAEHSGLSPAMARMLQFAKDKSYRLEPLEAWNALQSHPSGGYLFLEPVAELRKFRIELHGQGYRTLNRAWQQTASGRFFEDQPDGYYARMSSRSFWQAVETDAPIVESVDASMWVPGRGRTDLKYTRLLMPLEIGRKRRLLSMSHVVASNGRQLVHKP